MALNDNAVLTAAVGHVYVADVGTAAPSPSALAGLDLENPLGWVGVSGWESLGHTSRGDMPEFGFEGGDTEIRGSWQKKKLREVETDELVDHLTVHLHQFDDLALELYYGENASSTPGVFGVSSNRKVVEKAVLVIIADGEERIGFHAHKASIRRDDAIQLPIDDLASLPIRVTFLDYQTEPLFTWINEDLFNVAAAGPYTLGLGGATGGSFTLRVNGQETGSIAYDANAAAVKAAIVAVDDGIKASQVTVTADSGNWLIDIPALLTVGTDSTTGGTGISVTR